MSRSNRPIRTSPPTWLIRSATRTSCRELRSTTTREASDFLTEQLAEQREVLEASEQELQAYRERTDSVSLEDRQNVVVQRLSDLNAALTSANTARIQKEAAYDQVRGLIENPAAIDEVPLILSNPFVQQQKTELAQLQRQAFRADNTST